MSHDQPSRALPRCYPLSPAQLPFVSKQGRVASFRNRCLLPEGAPGNPRENFGQTPPRGFRSRVSGKASNPDIRLPGAVATAGQTQPA